jgi:hypothetical protein
LIHRSQAKAHDQAPKLQSFVTRLSPEKARRHFLIIQQIESYRPLNSNRDRLKWKQALHGAAFSFVCQPERNFEDDLSETPCAHDPARLIRLTDIRNVEGTQSWTKVRLTPASQRTG